MNEPSERALATTNGASVAIVERNGAEVVEVRDAHARLVFEFDPLTNKATLTLPEGDLAVRAPRGNIELEAGNTLKLAAKTLEVGADRAELSFKDLVYGGLRLAARVGEATLSTERLETATERLFERARSVFRRVEDLHQLKAGRTRTIVEGGHVVRSGHLSMEAREDAKIDGAQIHLG